jgi:hypothetical protein
MQFAGECPHGLVVDGRARGPMFLPAHMLRLHPTDVKRLAMFQPGHFLMFVALQPTPEKVR